VVIFTIGFLPGKLEVAFLDVGEGDSTFIRTYSGKTILIDGGGSTNPTIRSKIGMSVIIPFLLDSGVNSIDLVIATHGHTDHIQGLLPVLEQFKVDNLVVPSLEDEKEFKELLCAAGTRKVKVARCSKGDMISLDDKTKIEVLNPPACYNPGSSSINNTSIVLRFLYKETSILFTGDAEVGEETSMMEDKTLLDADILKVAHHGSDTSTCMHFLEKVSPKAAIISVGKNNFGHPSQDVLNRLADAGVQAFRTDEAGAVILRSNGRNISIRKTVCEGG
jgi:competence protein ComEC